MSRCPPLDVVFCNILYFYVVIFCTFFSDLVAHKNFNLCGTIGNPPHGLGENFLFVRGRHHTVDFVLLALLDVLAVPKYGNLWRLRFPLVYEIHIQQFVPKKPVRTNATGSL
jgi:hypothetical protein